MNNCLIKNLLAAAVFILLVFSFTALSAQTHAQTANDTPDNFLVTWRAMNYVPADYAGKILPSKSSSVGITFTFIDNGKFADLKTSRVAWFVNDTPYKSGVNLSAITVAPTAFMTPPSSYAVRIELSYQGAVHQTSFSIPFVSPKIILDAPYPEKKITPSASVVWKAMPYFFNVSQLSTLRFEWTVNGVTPDDSAGVQNQISTDLSGSRKGTDLLVQVSAFMITNDFDVEVAADQLLLTVQ